jgi:PAS domain S-box-containing protein
MSPTYRDSLSEDKNHPGVLSFGGVRMALLDIEAGFWGLRRQMEALVGRRLTDAVLQQAGVNGGASFARAFIGKDATGDAQALRDCLAAYQAAGFGHFEIEALEWPIGRALIRGTDTFEAWMMRQHIQKTDVPVCAYTSGVLVGFVNALSGRQDVVCVKRACEAQGAEACLYELLPTDEAAGTPTIAFDPDPFLSRQLNLLEVLFDRMPMGIVIFDRDLRVRRLNPTWANFVECYAELPANQVVPGLHFFDLAPGTEADMMPVFERVLAGETVEQESLRLEFNGVVSYWDAVLTPLSVDGEITGILHVCVDVTERKQTGDALRESEANLRSILQDAQGFGVYRVAVDDASPYGGRVVLVSPSIKELLGLADPYRFESWFENIHSDDLDRVVEANRRSVELGEAYDQIARWYNEEKQEWRWVRTVSNPIYDANGRLTHFNGMTIDITEQKRAEEAMEQMAQTLEQRVEERTRELSTLLEISNNVASTLELGPLLGLILDELKHVIDYDGATILVIEGEKLVVRAYRGPMSQLSVSEMWFPTGDPLDRQVLLERRPIIVSDTRGDTPEARAYRESVGDRLHTAFSHIRSWMGVPLLVKDQVIGELALDHGEPNHFTPQRAQLAFTFANQVAVAIENARLYLQVEQAAAMEERQRLARELHDSVSQALYGIGLGTRTARTLLDREPVNEETRAKLAKPLDYVLSLAEAGLAEMRALIFELRPDALEQEGLVAALDRQAAALRARHKLRVHTDFCEEPEVPLEVKEAVYRVAQEALNNIVKHARADEVGIRLEDGEDRITLEVRDDGVGFDPQQEHPGHLGLRSMQERAARLSGALEIESSPGHGALIRARISSTNTAQSELKPEGESAPQ